MKKNRKKLILVMLCGVGIVVFCSFYGILKSVRWNHAETISMIEKNEASVIPDIYCDFLMNFDTQEKQYYYSVIELNNYEYPIPLLSDGVYKDNQFYIAMWTDIYYYVDGEVVDFGNLLSGGTAYPIAAEETGIYTGSGHSVEKYNLSIEESRVQLVESCTVYFNTKGEATYIAKIADESIISTAKECEEQNQKYAEAEVIYFRELEIK